LGSKRTYNNHNAQRRIIVSGYTPMIEQYLHIKQDHPDAILFFRLGDFYEMFFEDAQTASRELEIVLTSRDGGSVKIPMCGVPHHAANGYIARLINKGFKVAVCDQVENPRQAVGIVKREITRVITPGTIIDDSMLDESRNNYLAAIVNGENLIGMAFVDVSTGDFQVTELGGPERMNLLVGELQRLEPAECLITAGCELDSLWANNIFLMERTLTRVQPIKDMAAARLLLEQQMGSESFEAGGLDKYSQGIMAAAAVLEFLQSTQKTALNHIDYLNAYQVGNYLDMDISTRRNLELTISLREGKKEGSLLGVLDYCRTPMGKRLIRRWLEQPLLDIEQIEERLDAVAEMVTNLQFHGQIRDSVSKIYDLERLAGKLGSGLASPRDLVNLKYSLRMLPVLKETLNSSSNPMLRQLGDFDPLEEVCQLIEISIKEDAPLNIKEGGIFKEGFREDIDELKSLSSAGMNWLLEFENQEREKTGIRSLKVGYNRVFGYYIEISNANRNMVPADYIRKQTLVNAERFITDELKKYEQRILSAREELHQLEFECFVEIRDRLQSCISTLQHTARVVASVDVLAGLALAAYLNDYVRPQLTRDGKIEIKSGRHPVVERNLRETRFVPNDINLDREQHRLAIITGPNMGGKSTFMRQTALLVIMAHMGSFVPADEAKICLVDRIFTRVGASDDLAAGQSTFMMEMLELANIIKNASRESLVILDEVGRGTSTYDGLSIAQAATEFIHDKIGCKTMFATHYHELTHLADVHDGIFNLSVSVLESGEQVTFLKKVLAGKADKSYGLHVAKLAGIAEKIILRAYDILDTLQKSETKPKHRFEQISLFAADSSLILDELAATNIDDISPRDALMLLYRWKEYHHNSQEGREKNANRN